MNEPTGATRDQGIEAAGSVGATPLEEARLACARGDYATALQLLRPLANQGVAEAQSRLGFLYAHGYGVSLDNTAAAQWYRRAADQGLAPAQCNLGRAYHEGRGVALDYGEAMRWYQRAADQDNADGQYNLALLYANGHGTPQDDAQAARWYCKAAEQDHPEAQFNLGVMYANGHGVPQDDAQAYHWFNLASSGLRGQTDNLAAKNRDIVAAKVIERAIAEIGRGDALTALRRLYPLADHGNAAAQHYLGLMYHKGQGAPQNVIEAARWYEQAAVQGHAAAQNNLGVLYANGLGVPRNYVDAYKWLTLAVSQRAADHDTMVETRNRIAAAMTREQLTDATRRAREWKAAGAYLQKAPEE